MDQDELNRNSSEIFGYHVGAIEYLTKVAEFRWAAKKNVYDDFSALYGLVSSIKNSFTLAWSSKDSVWYHTVSTTLPVEPYNELFEKMTEKQMESFYQKFASMLEKLDEVKTKEKRSDACSILVDVFGDDFLVTVDKSMVGTSESA